ncbi:hypothetical protein BGZ99_001687 [Dissophora globulifera]|uniref:Uncharacterized protein n=1 Tax=Dissophora globulifera TaxID=979702 RepID=A0A9P6RQF2_9FUNG|nr:hypothetical protein BGZ99_001687 [Dissophora globulifera]
MSFTLQTTLDTKVPYIIEFLGPPNERVVHQVSGKVILRVQKPVQIKHMSVLFHGGAYVLYNAPSSDGVDIARVEVPVITTPTLYQSGEYTLLFQMPLPGDLATIPCSQLKSDSLAWRYDLITSALPTGLFSRRKVIRQQLTLRRVQVPPSDTQNVRYGAKRAGEFECSMYAPKFVSCSAKTIHLSVYMHPYNLSHSVKEIQAQAIQTEKISFDSKPESKTVGQSEEWSIPINLHDDDRQSLIKSDDAKTISNTVIIKNPGQDELSSSWGREDAVELELEVDTQEVLPAETLPWIKIGHGVRFTFVFADSSVRNLVVMAPFQVGHVLEDAWTAQPAPDGLTPPDYGVDDDHSTLLDSNTSRMTRQQLVQALYPEREPVVPDLADDLPPVYEHEEGRTVPYSEKH